MTDDDIDVSFVDEPVLLPEKWSMKMLIQNCKGKIIAVAALDGAASNRDHWVGREGEIESVDIGKCMTFAYKDDAGVLYCRTKAVDEILVRGNTVGVEDGIYRYLIERME